MLGVFVFPTPAEIFDSVTLRLNYRSVQGNSVAGKNPQLGAYVPLWLQFWNYIIPAENKKIRD